MVQARKRIMDMLEKVMNERSGSACGHQDFLQRLLEEKDNKLNEQEGRGLTDEEIKDNILTMVIAGKAKHNDLVYEFGRRNKPILFIYISIGYR